MSLRLLIGLGNPGNAYAQHRHNFGFMCLDALVKAHGADWQNRHNAQFSQFTATINSAMHKIMALKPQDFMNRSGQVSGQVARYYRIDSSDILVLYDELDLPLGKVRHRLGGGAGGHNGIRDLLQQLDGDFHRLRLGIGHPGEKSRVQGHVLSAFTEIEKPLQQEIINQIARHSDLLLTKQFGAFMNKMAPLAATPKLAQTSTQTSST